MVFKTLYYAFRNIINSTKKAKLDRIIDHSLAKYNKHTINIAIHGSLQNHSSSFYDMVTWFDNKGILIVPLKYDYNLSVGKAALQIKRQVNELIKDTKAKKINIIAHSYGGLVARYYIQNLNGAKITNILITMGTLHHGTKLGSIIIRLISKIPGLIKDEEIAGNKVISKLNKNDRFRRHIVIIGRDDILNSTDITYYDKAKKTICLKGIGHLGELHDAKCFKAIYKVIK